MFRKASNYFCLLSFITVLMLHPAETGSVFPAGNQTTTQQ